MGAFIGLFGWIGPARRQMHEMAACLTCMFCRITSDASCKVATSVGYIQERESHRWQGIKFSLALVGKARASCWWQIPLHSKLRRSLYQYPTKFLPQPPFLLCFNSFRGYLVLHFFGSTSTFAIPSAAHSSSSSFSFLRSCAVRGGISERRPIAPLLSPCQTPGQLKSPNQSPLNPTSK